MKVERVKVVRVKVVRLEVMREKVVKLLRVMSMSVERMGALTFAPPPNWTL